MRHQMRRIIKWKSRNRLISAKMKKLRTKIKNGDFTERDLKDFESLAIEMGRNISRLYRMRTKISQQRKAPSIEEQFVNDAIKSGYFSNETN